MWYPGQEGGWATADILLGRVDPAGRLPVTFPKRLEDTPVHAKGHPERNAPPPAPGMMGLDPNAPAVRYTEGLSVGYRWYDQERIEPLFPFGFGLSYTRFTYSNLLLKPGVKGLDVTFTVRNGGSVRGSEVVQVYLERPARPAVPMPLRSLAAFETVELDPGASRTLTLRIAPRAFEYWTTDLHDWAPVPGARAIQVGASSRDIRLFGSIAPPRPPAVRPAR
jgi:beta-glucosidase